MMASRRSVPALLLTLWLAVSWTLGFAPGRAAAASLNQYRRQENQVTQQLATARSEYALAQQAWSKAHRDLNAADAKLVTGAQRLKQLNDQVVGAKQTLAARQTLATRARVRQQHSQNVADQAVVALFTSGQVRFIDVLFGATSFADFISRAELLLRIWQATAKLLQQARTDRQAADAAASAAATALDELRGLQTQAAATVQQLQQQARSARAAWVQEQQAVTDVASAVRALLQQKAGLEAAIARLLAELDSGKLSLSQLNGLITSLAKQFGLDPRLIEAVVIEESGGNPKARSRAGALGLMQLMPGTAAALGVTDPLDPTQNLRGGINYLLDMLQRFHGNLAEALAAYNAGPNAVAKYGGIPPYPETQRYVQNVLSLYKNGK